MRSEHPADECLEDIVDNAQRIESYIGGMDRVDVERDGRTWDAVERCLERICEAVHRLGDRAEQLMPGHPWGDISGMGNRLRHAYNRINLDVVWNAATRNVPPLAADTRRALDALNPDGSGAP